MRPTRRDTPFREAMRSLLVFDGAMGSLLYERGIFVMQNFEQLNVTRPDVVAKIHEDYVNAGANIIETNTFGANSFRLDRHGLGDQVRAFNLAGARLALASAERMRVVDLPLCVQPNAGLPRTVDGRLLYMATPEYFDVFARRTIQIGATMVGGCCGTTPEHVRWMAKSGRMLGDQRTDVGRARAVKTVQPAIVLAPTPLAERSAFAAKIAAGKFVVSVEVNPAPGLDPSKALAGAKMLLDSGVDIVNVADAPRAMARMSNIAFCSLLLGRHGIQPILHVCGRDRNLLAQMEHLLGAHAIV